LTVTEQSSNEDFWITSFTQQGQGCAIHFDILFVDAPATSVVGFALISTPVYRLLAEKRVC